MCIETYDYVCLCVSQGHVDEMWGLATHPSQNIFITCGHDKQVCLWDAEQHKLEWCITLEVDHNFSLMMIISLKTCGTIHLKYY